MGGCETKVYVGGSFTPMERIVITANGNLQRIMSAHYGAPVSVTVKKCDKIGTMLYDRQVDIMVGQKIFCEVVGSIEIYDPKCIEAIGTLLTAHISSRPFCFSCAILSHRHVDSLLGEFYRKPQGGGRSAIQISGCAAFVFVVGCR
jgi:hypothetical protein